MAGEDVTLVQIEVVAGGRDRDLWPHLLKEGSGRVSVSQIELGRCPSD
jgi:hypothetical protein